MNQKRRETIKFLNGMVERDKRARLKEQYIEINIRFEDDPEEHRYALDWMRGI